MKSPKQQFLDAFEQERERTIRVLSAYPDDQSGFKPHERSRTAREVSWPLAVGLERLILKALADGSAFAPAPSAPAPPPEKISEITAAVEETSRKIVAQLRDIDDAKLDCTVKFFVAPKTLGDVPMMDFLWSVLFDHVHHRGQLSVYLRILGKVPSIYGPSGDEPWR